jgi:hypothetical protein
VSAVWLYAHESTESKVPARQTVNFAARGGCDHSAVESGWITELNGEKITR